MKKRIFAILLCACAAIAVTGCGASWDRTIKDLDSNFGGGLDRTVTVYDMQGEPIREYTGKIDVEKQMKVRFCSIWTGRGRSSITLLLLFRKTNGGKT